LGRKVACSGDPGEDSTDIELLLLYQR